MRTLTLSKSGFNKIRSHQKELKASDLEGSVKSIPPGEWCFLSIDSRNYVCFVNAMVEEKFPSVHVLDQNNDKDFSPENYVAGKLREALAKRKLFHGYEKGSRIFYGSADGLPGLIIDHFVNAVIIQINTAGVDKFRDHISAVVSQEHGCKSYFLDNHKYREREGLPVFSAEAPPSLEVEENELRYHIRSEVLQKVGFYYDHRENRKALQDILTRLSLRLENGVDLFCYVGAWGMNALKAGIKNVDFIDQGDFQPELMAALELNGFTGRGKFLRGDVFRFIDDAVKSGRTYDLILSDPPAFAKNPLQKNQALEGYSKLHRRIMKIAAKKAVAVFSSCTHYVGHEEFQKNVLDAALKEGKKIQLLHTGIQGWDHPIRSQADKSNYIKSYFYLLES